MLVWAATCARIWWARSTLWNSLARQGPLRGVTFLDAAGESMFGVYVPEGADKKPALVAQFEKTRAVIAALPRVCG